MSVRRKRFVREKCLSERLEDEEENEEALLAFEPFEGRWSGDCGTLGFWRIVVSSGLGVSRKWMMREIISVGRVRRVMARRVD